MDTLLQCLEERGALNFFAAEEDIEECFKCHNEAYRMRQIRKWIYEKLADNFDVMTDLSKELRRILREKLTIYTLEVKDCVDVAEQTKKLLLETPDGYLFEVPILERRNYATVCLSTQVGCPVGCIFCASGKRFKRNLTSSEIIQSFLIAKRIVGNKLKNVVLMGMGEPLLNYSETVDFLKKLKKNCGISMRHVTLSTVGIPSKIRQLARSGVKPRLAVSLHFTSDEMRRSFMPGVRASIKDVLDAAYDYYMETSRRVSIEYILFGAGVNSTPDDAGRLVSLLRFFEDVHVNLIPYNPVPGVDLKAPGYSTIKTFANILKKAGLNVTIRWSQGKSENLACGQLAWKRGKN